MPTKDKLSVRISRLHREWLDRLCEAWNMNEGECVQTLIDRAWREYAREMGLSVYNTPSPDPPPDDPGSGAARLGGPISWG